MMRSELRPIMAIALAVAVLVGPTMMLAQEASGTASEGVVAGQMDGRNSTNGGCLFNWLGVGAAYLILPNPPATRLLGKSSEYVAAYTDAYRDGAKGVQTKNAWTGCVVSGLGYVVYVVVVVLAAAAAAVN
jgi:hypothetical protein